MPKAIEDLARNARHCGDRNSDERGDVGRARADRLTTWSYVSELQRDWAREETAGEVTKLFEEHGGGFGQGLRWEWQLLSLKEGTR
jgi:hypothetical protein